MKRKTLRPSEAVYGFAAWLTCRKDTLKIGSSHDASQIAELCKLFCEENYLSDPGDNWTDILIHPKDNS